MNKALKKVAKRYSPGKVATEAQMLGMAQRIAAEDTDDAFVVEHYPEPSLAPKRAKSIRSRS